MDHVRPFSPARRYTFQQKYLQNPSKTRTLQAWPFVVVVVVVVFFGASRTRILMTALYNVLNFHRFLYNCHYFLRVATHFENCVFIWAPFAVIIFMKV